MESLYTFAEKYVKLARQLETSTVFSGTSNRTQNDLFETVSDVIQKDIEDEINAAPCVAVEEDETTDVTNKGQISVILCYVAKCEVNEAFLGFDDVSDAKRAGVLVDYVL